MNKSIKPEDVLSDEESSKIIDGVHVRKGTVGAVLVNAKILAASPTASEKQAALVVLGVYDHIQWKNGEIQQIIEEAAKGLHRF